MPFRASRVPEQPMQQKQKPGRRKHDKCPASDVVLEYVTVDYVEGRKATNRDCGSQAFFPPRHHHSDRYANRKEEKSDPLCASYLCGIKRFAPKKIGRASCRERG